MLTLIFILGGAILTVTLCNRIAIMAKLSELATALTALADQTDKIAKEVQALKDALANTELPPEATAALDRLTAALKGVDDLNPDAPETPPTA